MNILAIDTSALRGSIALASNEKILHEVTLDTQGTHCEKLLPAVAAILKEAHWDFSDLQGLSLAVGPGSFTGLRIGLAAMKAFAQSHSLPLVGISTLEALAYHGCTSTIPVAAVLEAKRKEVYAAVYQFSDGQIYKILLEEQAISPDLLGNTLKKIGDCLVLKEGPPLASWVAKLAWSSLKRGGGNDWKGLVPNYLRPSDAERLQK